MAGACGDCSLCCKVMAIPEIPKDDGVWCQHICKNHKGCGIYETRPQVCRDFLCMWRMGMTGPGTSPKHMRPDRCGVVFGQGTREDIIGAYVDPARPNAWRKPRVWEVIENLVMADFNVVLSAVDPAKPETTLKRTIFYKQHGAIWKIVKSFTPPDAKGVQWVIHAPEDRAELYRSALK